MKPTQADQSAAESDHSEDFNNVFYDRHDASRAHSSKLTDRGENHKDARGSPDIFIQSFHRLSQLEKIAQKHRELENEELPAATP